MEALYHCYYDVIRGVATVESQLLCPLKTEKPVLTRVWVCGCGCVCAPLKLFQEFLFSLYVLNEWLPFYP